MFDPLLPIPRPRPSSILLPLAWLTLACSAEPTETDSQHFATFVTSESMNPGTSSSTGEDPSGGDGDGDPSSSGDGDGEGSTSQGSGDGDGDPRTTGDGDGEPDPDPEAWSFVALSDSRGSDNGIAAGVIGPMAEVIASLDPKPELVIYPGDLVDVGTQSQLNAWLDAFAPVYDAGMAVYTVPGNHEDEAVGGWESLFSNGSPYQHPGAVGSPDGGRTYYVEHKNALFVGVGWGNYDTSWVEDTMQVHGADKDHIVVFQHHPLVGAAANREGVPNGGDLVTAMKSTGAQFYFAGHDHTTNHAAIDGGSVHQWIVGMAGAPNYPATPYRWWGDDNPYSVQRVENGVPDDAYAMVVVNVVGASASAYVVWWDQANEQWEVSPDGQY